MTSNDAPASAGGPAGRRRALGRGPGALPAPPPTEAETETEAESGPSVLAPAPPAGPAPEPAAGPVPAPPAGPVPAPPAGPAPEPAAGPAPEPPVGPAPEPPAEAAPSAPEPPGPPAAPEGDPAAPAGAEAPGAAEALAESGPAAGAEPGDGVFKVRLANFEGPFDLLLQLISRHKMDVTEVALSRVTDEFMAHIRAMGPDWDLDQTTEFLVVAATLLDLKAARLLPAAEVEDEADLALLEARDLLFARLLQYRAYKQIADIFNTRLLEEGRRYPRTVGLEPQHAELLPEVVISIGAEGFARLAVKAMQPKPKPQVYVDHIHAPLVSVREQAEIVVARLRERGEVSFRVLVEDTEDTLTVVARFLALLELYREKAVALDQEEALGELLVRWTGGDGEEQPRVTDEFDRPPEDAKEEKKA
ncbi:segregation and condensation protein A [Streptomyces sp. NPDC002952]|uniref:segregation and condensation protein A n=1 Tax=Streptomyces sp. NPDC002952 TaxID=3364673 RepID=UPI00369BB29C